jgi:uncharacterized protein YqgV (UPF0045/DUF77 family)
MPNDKSMNHQVHVSIQIVPKTNGVHPYKVIDKAIELIHQSGIKYQVGAMETVMQGDFDTLMKVAMQAQEVCFDEGAEEIVVTMKVHARKNGDVTWEEKKLDRRNY